MKKKIMTLTLVGLSLIGLASCNINSTNNNTTTTLPIDTSTTTPQNSSSIASTSASTSTPVVSSSTSVGTISTPAISSSTSAGTISTPAVSSSSSTSKASTSKVSTSTTEKKTSYSNPSYSSVDEINNGINITEIVGYNEAAYVKFEADDTDYNVYYKKVDDDSFTKIDDELVRINNDIGRADILGLNPGNYVLKIENKNNPSINTITNSIAITKQDRSGYAHFNYNEGVGAYNDDGSLKDNTTVVYVNDDNKNTVEATIAGTKYVGLSDILKHSTNASNPVCIRILGTIGAATWPSTTPSVSAYTAATNTTVKGVNGEYLSLKNYTEEEIIQGGYNTLDESEYSKLNGLTNKIKYDSSKSEFDSYYNMLDISGAKNVTVEGVGDDAEIFQWGFTWKSDCKSIEVKNITFNDYAEDACSFEGSGSDSNLTTISAFTSTRYWLHNNTFNRGVNYWDVCSEQDKHDGDGSTDLKRVAYVTFSYNQYNNCHKTGLVGGSDTQMTASVTFHHNYYNECQSRLPFARQANMHMYNNYYNKSTGNNMQIYAGAYAFIENCYFDSVKNTYSISDRGIALAAVKSYNNIYNECSSGAATIVSSRTEAVDNENVFNSHFDVDPSVFYFNNNNNISDVDLMFEAENVPTLVPLYAGAGKAVSLDYSLNIIEKNEPATIDDDTKNYATYTNQVPTAAGLYYHTLDANNNIADESNISDTTYVLENKGKITIHDSSATESTVGYYILDNTPTTGTVTYSFDVTLTGVGSKWNFARFLDNTGKEVLAIRVAADTKYIAYTLNGDDTTETVIKSTAFKAGTYSISLTVNYNTSTATLSVGTNSATISNFNSQIIGFKFMTAVKATDRSFTVTNIKVE